MFGGAYLPFRPIKGQQFTLYFSSIGIDYNAQERARLFVISQSSITWTISKDGGSFATPSNSVTEITTGHNSLVLTATEMAADVIILQGNFSTGTVAPDSCAMSVIIYTTLAELGAAPTLNSSIADKVTAIFQYLFFKRTVTATAEALFKDDTSTTLATNTISDNGTTVTKGKIS